MNDVLLDNISFNGKSDKDKDYLKKSYSRKQIHRQCGEVTDLTTVKKIGNKYKITTMKIPVRETGFELKRKTSNKKATINDDKLLHNLIRAKTTVRELALCNQFDYFVTLTLDKAKYDRYNLPKFIKDLGQFIRDYRKATGCNVQYILIPEQHKDGAWHIHGLISNILKSDLICFDNIENAPMRLKGKGYYNFVKYEKKFGFNSFGKIKDMEKVANYITKYITKSFGENIELNKKSYYSSRGLNKPITIKKGLLCTSLEYDFENEYCKIKNVGNIEDLIIKEYW